MNPKTRSLDEHMEHIQSEGMSFPDMGASVSLFSWVSCFRLKYYWRNLVEADTDEFQDSASCYGLLILQGKESLWK